MKKYFAVLFILTALQGNAQKHSLEYGLQTALNINSANGNAVNKDYKSTLTGFGIGSHVKLNFSEHFGTAVQMQFDQNGWRYHSLTFYGTQSSFSTGDVLYRLNYINIPVMVTYSAGKKVRFTAGTGLFAGLLMSGHYITKIKEPVASTAKSKTSGIRDFNFGIAAEATVQIPILKRLHFDIGLHNNFGLANIDKPLSSSGNSYIQKTNALSLVAGLTWSK